MMKDGTRRPLQVKEGDTVLFTSGRATSSRTRLKGRV